MYLHGHTIRTSGKGGQSLKGEEQGRREGLEEREGVRAHGRRSVPP